MGAVSYSGPRTFRAKSLDAFGELLDRAFNSVDQALRRLSDGTSRRWESTETLRTGNGVVRPNVALECDTVSAPGNAITLTLRPSDSRNYGTECGIVRLSGTGTITLFPIDGARLDGSTASQAIPATAGFYVLVITPSGYWLRR